MSLGTGARLGPYEILGLVGAGGMGAVYRARDTRLDRDVAIKVLADDVAHHPDRLARFNREAHAIAALSHPNVVAIHDVGTHESTAFVVMELLDGITLRQQLERGPLPVRKAVAQAIEIARGLAAAHDKGIVHRDLKPENVIVTADGRVKVLDFGLARRDAPSGVAQADVATVTRDTAPGVVLGTVGYMSPEQVQGQPADARSDVFALGCVLYEMLAGQRAFTRTSAAETMTAILREDPPALTLSGGPLPQALERTLRRCIEKHPAERFQSARDVAFALEAVSPDSGSREVVASPQRTGALRRLLLAAGVASALLAGIALGLYAGRRPDPSPSAGLAFKRLTFRQGPIVSARFGPDGRTVFYGAAWEGRPFRIYQTGPEGGELALPYENADLLSVSRDGQLALLLPKRHGFNPWWKVGTLATVPMLGAAPHEVAEDVRGADWAPDGKTLAVVRESGGVSRLEYPLGTTIHEANRGWIFNPRVSPSGDRVAFFEGTVQEGFTVKIVDRLKTPTTLSGGWEDWYDLVWSPDSREVWFGASKPCAGLTASLYAVDLQGRLRNLVAVPGALDIHDVSKDGTVLAAQIVPNAGGTRMWTGESASEHDISWLAYSWPVGLSPDGRAAILNSYGCQGTSETTNGASYLRPLEGTAPVKLADDFTDGGLSPDGRWLLISERSRLTVMPIGAGTERTWDLAFESASFAGSRLWMPDGEHAVVAALEADRQVTLRTIDLRDGSQRAASRPFVADFLTNAPNWLSPVSPDGRLVAAKSPAGLLLVPLDGGPVEPLKGATANELAVQWGMDGRSLIVFQPGVIPAALLRVDVVTGRRTPWKELRPPEMSASTVGAVYLSPDGRSGAYSYARTSADLYLVTGVR